jgi:hypothetical protein
MNSQIKMTTTQAIKQAKAETSELTPFGGNWIFTYKTGDNWRQSIPAEYFSAKKSRRNILIEKALSHFYPEDELYGAAFDADGTGRWEDFVKARLSK